MKPSKASPVNVSDSRKWLAWLGTSNLGAPDLSAEGAKNKGVQFQIDHLKCPSCANPGSPMPPFAALGEDNLRKLATFLEASKGPQ